MYKVLRQKRNDAFDNVIEEDNLRRVRGDTEQVRSDEEDDDPIQFQAKQTVTAADIKLRIDAPPSADNAVEVIRSGSVKNPVNLLSLRTKMLREEPSAANLTSSSPASLSLSVSGMSGGFRTSAISKYLSVSTRSLIMS